MLESADLLALLWWALSNSADGPQLLIFWQTVQRDSQSALVIEKSCSKDPCILFDQNLIENDQTPICLRLFSAALGTSDVTGTRQLRWCVKQYVLYLIVKND